MAQTDKNKTLQIVCYLVVAPQSGKAFLAEFRDEDGEVTGERWFPHSRVTMIVSGCGGFTVCGEKGDELVIELPLWLAEKPEIEPLIREQVLAMEGMGVDEQEDQPYSNDDGKMGDSMERYRSDDDKDFYNDDPGWGS